MKGIIANIAEKVAKTYEGKATTPLKASQIVLFKLMAEYGNLQVARRILIRWGTASGMGSRTLSKYIKANELMEQEMRAMDGGDLSKPNIFYASMYIARLLSRFNRDNFNNISNITVISSLTSMLYEMYVEWKDDSIDGKTTKTTYKGKVFSKDQILSVIGKDFLINDRVIPTALNAMHKKALSDFMKKAGNTPKLRDAMLRDSSKDRSFDDAMGEYYDLWDGNGCGILRGGLDNFNAANCD